ncbi:MAG: hypothetical protein M1834_007847 [Cirrosporium novae-zelandiae]|nr:MAG: hypothetical protein M1834_007847 [Cirrosporium novae-zelandiae]
MSTSQLGNRRSMSPGTKTPEMAPFPAPKRVSLPDGGFEPCAATASLFLCAQGPSVLCLHHDTLAIERRFQRHKENIVLISVDNVSERGAGRLVVSYDAGQTAIVWDLFTGEEIARFASFDHLRVAAWMRNGNVAFGNSQGSVILFEPSTSEHIAARTIFDPITALAPASDCRNYAIGYNNGSILIAALQPAFTILHTLSTNKAPSPIATLAWHASSSKQKSDMLATQTQDGDLRVWSIAKPPTADQPRVIRVLRRSDTSQPGPNWMAWSKNGRIVQYSERETWAWDVRTKRVTYERIPTIKGVRSLASYGPSATLFTLGPDHTVQQYDLNNPMIVAKAQHLPLNSPPTPPVTVEDQKQQNAFQRALGAQGLPLQVSTSESEEEALLSPLQVAVNEVNAWDAARRDRIQNSSPISRSISRSSKSMNESMSSRSSGYRAYNRPRDNTPNSQGNHSATTFTNFSPMQNLLQPGVSYAGIGGPGSQTSSTRSSRTKTSRLRQEILPSPEDQQPDLFPFTRANLSEVPYKHPLEPASSSSVTSDDLRQQMLSIVFGYDNDIEALVRDELNQHIPGSQSAILLSKWLGETDEDALAAMMSSTSFNSSDWMLLALSQMGSESHTKKIGHAFVQKLLAKGDVHAAVTVLIGLGDHNDAVEVYVSRNYYMEAVLLTCLLFRTDWQRQAHLVRRWGEFVVKDAEQQLAIRCFACTEVEPSEPWTSPTAQKAATFMGRVASPPRGMEPSRSPENPRNGGPTRMTTKNSALKLITSFGPSPANQFRFPGLKSDDRTPTNGPGITPIAESAISPGAGDRAFMRNGSRNIPSSARTMTPGGYMKRRLPSIGETPIDVNPPAFPATNSYPTPQNSGSDKEKDNVTEDSNTDQREARSTSQDNDLVLLSSARYEPSSKEMPKRSPMTAIQAAGIRMDAKLPDPSQGAFAAIIEGNGSRNGSRDRKPDGLHIQWPPSDLSTDPSDYTSSTDQGVTHDIRDQMPDDQPSFDSTSSLSNVYDSRSETRSPPVSSGQSYKSGKGGRSIDQYISSLEEANYRYRKHKHRQRSRDSDRRHRDRVSSRTRSKPRTIETFDDRGRGNGRIPPAKRSPSSPVPMSPEEYQMYNASTESFEEFYKTNVPITGQKSSREPSRQRKGHSRSRTGHSKRRYDSPSKVSSKPGSRTASRRQSPSVADASGRGRSKSKTVGSVLRSPSSPLPMAPHMEEGLRLVDADRQRLRPPRDGSRSTSRRPRERGTNIRREFSPDRWRSRERSNSRQTRMRDNSAQDDRREISEASEISADTRDRTGSLDTQSMDSEKDPQATDNEKLKKELAAKELEARRISLARRADEFIPFPGEILATRPQMGNRSVTDINDAVAFLSASSFNSRVNKASPVPSVGSGHSSGNDSSGVRIGLPATPRAMRHPKYMTTGGDAGNAPNVPDIPENLPTLNDRIHQAPTLASDKVFQDPLVRSNSAPVLEPRFTNPLPSPAPIPADLPTHPAFHPQLPPSSRSRTFSPPLSGFSKERKISSSEESRPGTLGYVNTPTPTNGEAQEGYFPPPTQKSNSDPPRLPQLQHLNVNSPIPPPPPAPIIGNESSPASSAVGTINIAIDSHADPPSRAATTTPIIEVPTPSPPMPSTAITTPPPISPFPSSYPKPMSPLSTSTSPPPSFIMLPQSPPTLHARSNSLHRRGRSLNESLSFSQKVRGFTGRMRSTSRGRQAKSPPVPQGEMMVSPYESIPPLQNWGKVGE